MSLARITQLLSIAGGRKLSARFPVWHLSQPWWPLSQRARRFEGLRAEIIANSLLLPSRSFLVIGLNPQEYEVGGPWAHAGADTWAVPGNCEATDLLANVLRHGSWVLYSAPLPIELSVLPDAFRCPPAEVADFASGHSIAVLIQAQRRNHPWRLWVEPGASQQRAAA